MDKEQKGRRFTYLCYEVFNDGLGKELMGHLNEVLQQTVADPDKDASYAYFREGENNIIRRFKAAIQLQHDLLGGKYARVDDSSSGSTTGNNNAV